MWKILKGAADILRIFWDTLCIYFPINYSFSVTEILYIFLLIIPPVSRKSYYSLLPETTINPLLSKNISIRLTFNSNTLLQLKVTWNRKSPVKKKNRYCTLSHYLFINSFIYSVKRKGACNTQVVFSNIDKQLTFTTIIWLSTIIFAIMHITNDS